MFQNLIMRQMLFAQLRKMNVPKDQQNKIVNAITKNPEFFKKMSEDMQNEMKTNPNQMQVAQKLAAKYQAEISKIMNSSDLN